MRKGGWVGRIQTIKTTTNESLDSRRQTKDLIKTVQIVETVHVGHKLIEPLTDH